VAGGVRRRDVKIRPCGHRAASPHVNHSDIRARTANGGPGVALYAVTLKLSDLDWSVVQHATDSLHPLISYQARGVHALLCQSKSNMRWLPFRSSVHITQLSAWPPTATQHCETRTVQRVHSWGINCITGIYRRTVITRGSDSTRCRERVASPVHYNMARPCGTRLMLIILCYFHCKLSKGRHPVKQ
jgi:hypothetical protein